MKMKGMTFGKKNHGCAVKTFSLLRKHDLFKRYEYVRL